MVQYKYIIVFMMKYFTIVKTFLINYYLIPYNECSIHSSLSKRDLRIKLLLNVLQVDNFTTRQNKDTLKDYEGIIKQNDFKIKRILKIGYNSFLPVVTGKFVNVKNGTEIRIKANLHKFVIIFLSISFLFSATIMCTQVSNTNTEHHFSEDIDKEFLKKTLDEETYQNLFSPQKTTNGVSTSPIITFLIFYVVIIIIFNFEIYIVKNDLKLYFDIDN